MRLTDCFIDLIAYVAYFMKSVDSRQPSFERVKMDVKHLISDSQNCLKIGEFSHEDYDLARFAIFAWIDEIILSSSWNERNRWLGEQLQRIYYNTSDAGEIFFEKLNSLGLHQRDVREVYYLCLALGFTGRYCNPGDELLLEQLKASNLKLLTGSSSAVHLLNTGELFPEAYSSDIPEIKIRKSRWYISSFTFLCLGFPVVLLIVLFVTYRFILSNFGENLLGMIP
jgi:type VI secretion system protein ImpK